MRILASIFFWLGIALIALQLYFTYNMLTDETGDYAISEEYGTYEITLLWIFRQMVAMAGLILLLISYLIRRYLKKKKEKTTINQFLE
ncbi:MAG: hypothetical protein JNK79_02190 [Chitinophagaceae bacterium]|nr:hypothetical protein [Chitinophagaceae bacterium]